MNKSRIISIAAAVIFMVLAVLDFTNGDIKNGLLLIVLSLISVLLLKIHRLTELVEEIHKDSGVE